MRNSLLLVVVAIICIASVNFAAGKGPDKDKVADTEAKALFVDNKCNSCHSITKANVMRKGGTQSTKIPDLSSVGAKHDAEWLTKWLKKEVDLNGKKHTIPWKGTDDQLATLTTWLETLKADTTATPGGQGGTVTPDSTKPKAKSDTSEKK